MPDVGSCSYRPWPFDTREPEVPRQTISPKLRRRVVGLSKVLDCHAHTRTIFVENQELQERHNVYELVFEPSTPPAEIADDEFIIEKIVGHTQGNGPECEYTEPLAGALSWQSYLPHGLQHFIESTGSNPRLAQYSTTRKLDGLLP